MMIRIFLIFISTECLLGAQLRNCPTSEIRFQKVIGVRPPDTSHSLLLFKSNGTFPQPITTQCISKCHENEDCRSFVIFYKLSTCYWFKSSTEGEQDSKIIIASDVAWFEKVCLKEKSKCEKLWIFERVPGAALIGNDTKILPNKISRTDCQQSCLNETDFICRSAKYKISNANYGPNANTSGTCILSNANREMLTHSYRVSSFDEEYFENQCAENKMNDTGYCAYEEYENVFLGHVDELYQNTTKENCEKMCNTTGTFNCRGYSILKIGSRNNIYTCYLHSEDTKVHGPKVLIDNKMATYYERATCLDISVSCTDKYMTVRYKPETDFYGRIYIEGYSDHSECYAIGQGKNNVISLKLALISSQCGITKARASDRILMAGTLILQYNSLIQTQGDRILKVGCIFGNESSILIGTGVTITAQLPNKGNTIVNISGNKTANPSVEMRVLDFYNKNEVSDTQLGQELQLIIEANTTDSVDVWAGNLVAMTDKDNETIYLLDDRGCPTNLNIFPKLTKIITNSSIKLIGNFQAFKFATSPVVRFSVMIQFCPEKCPEVVCAYNQSVTRTKRDTVSHLIHTINGTSVVKITNPGARTYIPNSKVQNELPLQYIMIVRDSKPLTDSLITGENKRILVAGYDYVNNSVCVDYSMVIGLILTWVIVQIVFVICCIMLVRKYKRFYENEYNRQSMEELHKNFGIGFSNLENRRVRWADDMT